MFVNHVLTRHNRHIDISIGRTQSFDILILMLIRPAVPIFRKRFFDAYACIIKNYSTRLSKLSRSVNVKELNYFPKPESIFFLSLSSSGLSVIIIITLWQPREAIYRQLLWLAIDQWKGGKCIEFLKYDMKSLLSNNWRKIWSAFRDLGFNSS